MANTPQVSIIGAGIAGLVLGRCLLKRGVQAVIFERDAFKPRHGYGITLHSSSYHHILPVLDLDENSFKRKISVDAAVGGSGRESNQTPSHSSFRANRLKFEELLREGLDVRWEYKLKDIQSTDNGINVQFENGKDAQSQIVVGADGVHSQVRKTISPTTDFTILPFAVYNGKRRLKPQTFDAKYAEAMQDTTILNQRSANALLSVSINERTTDKASISYTYSRPAHQSGGDALFRPQRPITGATDIPSEFHAEIERIQDLPEPFGEVFRPDTVKDDRLLNWLMRSTLVPEEDLNAAAENGIVLLGDSCHHGPILGSEGANEAIDDAVQLAECIASGKDLREFYKARYSVWTKSVQEGEARLADLHGVAKSSL